MPAKVVYTPEEIWNYSTRLLTQTQFPFWKSVIMLTDISVLSPGAGVNVTKDVIPPTGETWEINILAGFQAVDDRATFEFGSYDGTTFTPMNCAYENNPSLGELVGPGLLGAKMIIDASLYARLSVIGGANNGAGAYAGYSGYVLGTKKLRPRGPKKHKWRLEDTTLPKGCYKYFDHRIMDYVIGFELQPKTPVVFLEETNTPIVFEQAYMTKPDLEQIVKEYIAKGKNKEFWKHKHLDKHLEKITYYAKKLLSENI